MSAKKSHKKAHGVVGRRTTSKRATPLLIHDSPKKTQISEISVDWKRVEEWDFSRVSDVEIKDCLLYEYAREKLRRSDDLRKKLAAYKKPFDFDFWELCRKHFRTPFGQVIPTATMLEEPWIDFIQKQKKKYGRNWSFKALAQEYQSYGFAAKFTASTDIAYFMKLWARWNQAGKLDTSAFEFGCFCIDWNHTDADIKKAFNSWLDDRSRFKQMPVEDQKKEVLKMASPKSIVDVLREPKQDKKTSKRVCKYSNRGKALRADMARAYLKSLGAFRLRILGKMNSLASARAYAERKSVNGIFDDNEDWYAAEGEVIVNLKKFFSA
jgi:hypothetical protein